MVKVVCFDVGGVLIKITQNWHEAAAYAKVPILSDIAPDAHLLDAPFFDAYQAGSINDEQYIHELAAYLGNIPLESAERVHNHIMMEPYPFVDQIVNQLNEQGFVTACLSNTNEPHWHDMFHSGRFPANEALKVRMASHLVGISKPDAGIFEAFESEVGATGDEIVFFDDTLVNIEAVRPRGWKAYLIDPNQPTHLQIASGLAESGINIPFVESEAVKF